MIELMSIMAVLVGVFFGWFIFRRNMNIVLMMLTMLPYRSRSRFMNLYDLADDEVTFGFVSLDKIDTYADYLRLHGRARKRAYEYYRHSLDNLIRLIRMRLFPIALAPAIIFWENWYWYLAGVFVFLIGYILYDLGKHNFKVGFYQRSMIGVVLNGYINDKDSM